MTKRDFGEKKTWDKYIFGKSNFADEERLQKRNETSGRGLAICG
jgi:hypothetical protein